MDDRWRCWSRMDSCRCFRHQSLTAATARAKRLLAVTCLTMFLPRQGRSRGGERAAHYAHRPFRAAASNDRGPPYAMFQRRVDQCTVWAEERLPYWEGIEKLLDLARVSQTGERKS